MSILIKGMSKPKTCDDCIVPLSKCDYLQKRADNCPLIEIPIPHGRLIDGDELRATLRRWTEDEWNQKASPVSWAYAYEDLIDLIDDAPTILEAEG